MYREWTKIKLLINSINTNSNKVIDHIRLNEKIFNELMNEKYRPKSLEEEKLFETAEKIKIVLDKTIRSKKGYKVIFE